MHITLILVFSIVFFLLAYFTYGSYIQNKLQGHIIDEVPSKKYFDKNDHVPTHKYVLLGHHFASIAGSGPIVGPVAALIFGWVPALLWILFGNVFIGAVHDYLALKGSIHHEGKSIGTLVEHYIGKKGKKVFLIFSWSSLLLVIGVFLNLTAQVFVSDNVVATASMLFILAAVFIGIALYKFNVTIKFYSFLAITSVVLVIIYSLQNPFNITPLCNFLQIDTYIFWVIILTGYILLASLLPVWLLLQPRDYLCSFLLYAAMIASIVGIIATGFYGTGNIQMPAFNGWYAENVGPIFPMLFVTIACGAVSGFHSLVASGTTAKQLEKVEDAKLIGYGAMLIEGVLAVIAVCAIAVLPLNIYQQGIHNPVGLFTNSTANFLALIGIPAVYGKTLIALAISSFLLTTLDTATRITRLLFSEIMEDLANRIPSCQYLAKPTIATIITVILCLIVAFSDWRVIWPAFGSANQLLAALTLVAITMWFAKMGKSIRFMVIPTGFMCIATICSLLIIAYKSFMSAIYLNTFMSLLLIILAVYLFIASYKQLKGSTHSKTRETITNS